MSAVGRALWFIEHSFARELSLAEIAAASHVSRFHLSRSFAMVTGQPVMAYVRGRRLTVAARMLADGAPNILAVALAAGYGSHEAFTRAFREHFGLTPEAVRQGGAVDPCKLLEPFSMNSKPTPIDLETPELVEKPAMTLAGLGQRFDMSKRQGITSLWQDFGPHLGHIPGQKNGTAYGLCAEFTEEGDSFLYMAGTEVTETGDLPEGFTTYRVPATSYLAFKHPGHISGIDSTMYAIWTKYLPESGYDYTSQTFSLEYYGPGFDPRTGMGDIEVWMPVRT